MTDGTDVASAVLVEKDAANAVTAVYTPGVSERRGGQSRWYMRAALRSSARLWDGTNRRRSVMC